MAHLSGNPAWQNYPVASSPISAAALENLEAVADGNNPLVQAGLRANKLILAKLEGLTIPIGVEQTLLNVTGPGVVQSLWMALGGGSGPSLDARLRVFYDGSATPAIDIDFGTLLAIHWGANGVHQTPHVSAQILASNANVGLLLTFPMPFGASIRVTYYNSTPLAAVMFSMITYRLTPIDYTAGQRLRCQGVRYAGQAITRTAGTVTTLATIPTGPGWIVWHSQVGGIGAVNGSWMERNFTIRVDGEAIPSLIATGTEDWFDSAWYFEGWWDFMSGPFSYVGADNPSGHPFIVGMATDLMAKWGGVPFQTGAVMTVETEVAVSTGDTFSYCVLYYSV